MYVRTTARRHGFRTSYWGEMMFKYEIILYWSNDDAAFVAEVPELPGCMAHGRTQEEALREVNEAMRLRIETARESGDPMPAPKGDRPMLGRASCSSAR